MAYADRFKVGAWLEEPAKWLSWAIDTANSPKDQAWNLQQFWNALALRKASNLSAQQWGEILLLDSRAQSTLGGYYLAQAGQQAKNAAIYSVDTAWAKAFVLAVNGLGAAALLPKVREFLAKTDPALKAYQSAIQATYDKAQAAFTQAAQMADQSNKAQASVQAERAKAQAKTGQISTNNGRVTSEQYVKKTSTDAGPKVGVPNALNSTIAGIPAWGWLLAVGAVALIVVAAPAAPTVMAVDRARRLA